MMGMRVVTTGRGVLVPRKMRDRATLKAGSSVFTVCVREMATAAKDRLAATWPTACMAAGPKMVLNSSLLMGCAGRSWVSAGAHEAYEPDKQRLTEPGQLPCDSQRAWPQSVLSCRFTPRVSSQLRSMAMTTDLAARLLR